MQHIIDIHNPIWINIIQYLDITQIIYFVTTNNSIYNLSKSDDFWKQISYQYKDDFFWKLAYMRSETKNMMLCDRTITWKKDFINIYEFDKKNKKNKNLNELYYYMWIFVEHNINKYNAYNMQKLLYKHYKLLDPFNNRYNDESYNESKFIIRQKEFKKRFLQ